MPLTNQGIQGPKRNSKRNDLPPMTVTLVVTMIIDDNEDD